MSAVEQPQTAEQLRARIVAPVDAERRRIEEGRAETMADIAAEDTKHAGHMRRWQKQADEAEKAFRPTPPAPTPRDMSGHTALLHRAVTALGECTDWEQRLLGEHRPHIEAAARHAATDLLERTRRTPLGDVEQILPEWNSWLSLLKEARGAAGRAGGVRPHNPEPDRMRKTITATDLLDALAGTDLMAVAEIPFLDRATRNIVARDPDGFGRVMRERTPEQTGVPRARSVGNVSVRKSDGPTGITREQAADNSRARLYGSDSGAGRF